jgi:integrase
MTTKEAINLFNYYLQLNHKQRTLDSYRVILGRFAAIYGQRPLDAITPDEIFHFLKTLTQNLAKSTRRLRYAQEKAFYNFIIDKHHGTVQIESELGKGTRVIIGLPASNLR